MAAQTFSELESEVTTALGNRSDQSTLVKRKINEALVDLAILVRPPALQDVKTISTVASTAEYTLQAATPEVFFILSVKNTTASKVLRLRRGTLIDYDEQDLTRTGRPTRWVRTQDDKIAFYRLVPDAVYSIQVRFLKRPTFLVNAGDPFPFDIEYEEPAKLLATAKLFSVLNEPAQAQAKLTEFNALSLIRETHQQAEDEWDEDAGMQPILL